MYKHKKLMENQVSFNSLSMPDSVDKKQVINLFELAIGNASYTFINEDGKSVLATFHQLGKLYNCKLFIKNKNDYWNLVAILKSQDITFDVMCSPDTIIFLKINKDDGYQIPVYCAEHIFRSRCTHKSMKQYLLEYNQPTIGQLALKLFKQECSMPANVYGHIEDEMCRASVCGGWNYTNEKYDNRVVEHVTCRDFNGLYSFVGENYELPDKCVYIKYDEFDSLKGYVNGFYIIKLDIDFSLKKGHFPSFNGKFRGNVLQREIGKNGTIYDSLGVIEICINSVELGMLIENYDIHFYELKCVLKYSSSTRHQPFFAKMNMLKDGAKNSHERTFYKLLGNSLVGKMMQKKDKKCEFEFDDEPRIVQMDRDNVKYSPVHFSSFVYSIAKSILINKCTTLQNEIVKTDTDSIFYIDRIDESNRFPDANWKVEMYKCKFKMIKFKTYMYQNASKKMYLKVAGCDSNMAHFWLNAIDDEQDRWARFDADSSDFIEDGCSSIEPTKNGLIIHKYNYPIRKSNEFWR